MGALEGKVAVVTGGASGIGLASARRLASEGATVVVVVDANGDGAVRAAESVGWRRRAGRRRATSGDWPRIVEAGRALGGFDIAHLNAGVTTGEEDIRSSDDEQYRRILSVNVDGIVFGTRALVPELVAHGGGAIVATSSLAGIVAFAGDPDLHAHQARRGGVRALGGAAPGRARHHHQRHLPRPGRHAAHRRRDPRRPGRVGVPAHRRRGRGRGRARVRARARTRARPWWSSSAASRSPTASAARPGPAWPVPRARSRRVGWPTPAAPPPTPPDGSGAPRAHQSARPDPGDLDQRARLHGLDHLRPGPRTW